MELVLPVLFLAEMHTGNNNSAEIYSSAYSCDTILPRRHEFDIRSSGAYTMEETRDQRNFTTRLRLDTLLIPGRAEHRLENGCIAMSRIFLSYRLNSRFTGHTVVYFLA